MFRKTNAKSTFENLETIPTKVGVSLSLPQWKVLCSATPVVDDLISRVKDGEPVDWKYDLGEDVYVIIKVPQLTIHIRKYFVPRIAKKLTVNTLEQIEQQQINCKYDRANRTAKNQL
jgi:hypothetical protein